MFEENINANFIMIDADNTYDIANIKDILKKMQDETLI